MLHKSMEQQNSVVNKIIHTVIQLCNPFARTISYNTLQSVQKIEKKENADIWQKKCVLSQH